MADYYDPYGTVASPSGGQASTDYYGQAYSPGPSAYGFDPTLMPRMAPPPKPNAFTAGLSSGISGFESSVGSGVQALGKLIGSDTVENYGRGVAERNELAAQKAGRADLDVMPWEDGGAGLTGLPAFLAYQGAKMLPTAAAWGAGALLAPEAIVPAGLARLGAAAPAMFGGGRALVGEAAEAAGAHFAKNYTGGVLATLPGAVGQQYSQAVAREKAGGEDADRGDALKAMALGIPYAALGGLEFNALGKIAAKGEAGGIIQRVATGAAKTGPAQMGIAAAQTAIDDSYRSDLTMGQKAQNVVDAAIAGGVVGGVIGGGLGGLRRAARMKPGDLTLDDLSKTVDEATIGPPRETQIQGPPAPMQGPTDPRATEGPQAPMQGPPRAEQIQGPQPMEQGPSLPIGPAPEPQGPPNPRRIQGPQPLAEGPPRADQIQGPPAPQAPANLAQLFAGQDDATISRLRAKLETSIAGGNIEPNSQTTRQLALLRAEEARRAYDALPGQPAEGGLFPETMFDQTKGSTPEDRARDERVKSVRDTAAQMAGRNPPWLKKLDIDSHEGLVDHIMDRLDDGKDDKATEAIGKKLGILDENGDARDHAAELPAARAELDRAQLAALTDPSAAPRVEAAKAKVAEIEQAQKVVQDAQERRAGGSAPEQQAQLDPTPTGSLTAPAPRSAPEASAAPKLDIPFAPEAPKPAPQTFGDTTKALSEIVGQPLKRGIAGNMPDAINAVADRIESGKNTNQAMTKIAQHFGLLENGERVALPDAIERTSQKLAAVKAEIDALPPKDARGSRVLAPRAAELQEKLDYLKQAHEARTKSEASSVAPPEKASAPTLVAHENAAADLAGKRQKLADISEDKGVPPSLRHEASIGEEKIRTGAADAAEHADHVLAAHEALSGDRPFAERAPAPDPMKDAAHDIRGEVVHQSENGGLIRTFDDKGKPHFIPVTRDGQRGMVDVSDYKGSLFNGREIAALRDAKKAFVEADQQAQKERPNGPFQEAKSNVVASENMDPRVTSLLTNWLQHLGLGNLKVFLMHPEDIKGEAAKYGLHGDFASAQRATTDAAGTFGPNDRHFYIALKPGMSDALTVENLGHELGHIVKWSVLQSASPVEKAAIAADFKKWQARNANMTPQELTKALRNQATGELEARTAQNADRAHMRYLRSEDEYFADQVGKYLTNTAAPSDIVGKFFSKVAEIFKTLQNLWKNGVDHTTSDLKPDQGIKALLDRLSESHPLEWNEALKNRETDSKFGERRSALGPTRLNEAAKDAMSVVDRFREKLENAKAQSFKTTAFDTLKVAMSGTSLIRAFKDVLPGIEKWGAAHDIGKGVQTRLHGLADAALRPIWRESKETINRINELMKASALGITPGKTWEQHPHLVNDPKTNTSEMQAKVKYFNDLWHQLGREQKQDLYHTLSASSEAELLAKNVKFLRDMVMADPEYHANIPLREDPILAFKANDTLTENPIGARDYFRTEFDETLKSVGAYLNSARAATTGKAAGEINRVENRLGALRDAYNLSTKQDALTKGTPYFHLGRDGDYMVRFDIKRDADGEIDRQSLAQVSQAMQAKGFTDFEIEQASKTAGVFIRLDTDTKAQRLRDIVYDLKDQGHVIGDVEAGLRSKPSMMNHASPEMISEYLRNLQANFKDELTGDPATDKMMRDARDHMLATARTTMFDMLPDTALIKVLSQRSSVAGYQSDMLRSFARRSEIGSTAISAQVRNHFLNDAYRDMTQQIKAASTDRTKQVGEVARMQLAMQEVANRDRKAQLVTGHTYWDAARAINHTYFLGLSPSYVLVNMTQVGTLVYPELGAKRGYVNAAKAIAEVTPQAFEIIRQMMAQTKDEDWRHKADGRLNNAVLNGANLDKDTKAFVNWLINNSQIEMGGAGRALQSVAENSHGDNTAAVLRYSSSVAVYSETLTRLIAGLAANKLHEKPGSDAARAYAKNVIDESLFNYNSNMQSRLLGPNGPLGKAGPLVMSFQTYTHRLIEKLYSEVHEAIKGDTQESREEARRFLLGHLAATTVAAGTLGAPTLALWIRAAEKIGETLTDDQTPWDLEASYRNHLDSIFGKTGGAIIAKGALSLTGADFASRTTEADIVPLTKLLTDKRKWEDASKDWASSTLGSPFSILNNIIEGGRDIAKGDILQGARAMLPKAFKGVDAATDMALHGFHDKAGNSLPLTPTGKDYLATVLGFNPASKADYDEAARSAADRSGQLKIVGNELRNKLATAIERGDLDRQRELFTKVQAYDRANPMQAVGPTMERTLMRRAQARALSSSMGGPLGVRPRDIAGRREAAFGDYGNQ